MSRYPSNKFDVFVADEATFGTARTTDADYQQIQPVDDSLELTGTTEQIDLNLSRADMMSGQLEQGTKSATAKLSLALMGGTDTNADGSVADLNPQYDDLLAACVTASAGTSEGLTAASSTTTVLQHDGDDPAVGDILAVSYNGTATPEVGQVQSISAGVSATLYTVDAISVQPTDDGIMYAGTDITPIDGGGTSVSIVANSIIPTGTDSIVDTVAGCLGNLVIAGAVGTDPGAFWQLQWDMLADSKARADDAAPYITVAGGASAIPTQANSISVNGSCSTVDGVAVAMASMSFDTGLVWSENTNACSTNARGQWILTERGPMLTVTVMDDPELTFLPESYYDDGTEFAWMTTMGTFPNSAALSLRRCQIMTRTKSDVNGIMAWDLEIKPLRPAEDIKEWTFTIFGDQT